MLAGSPAEMAWPHGEARPAASAPGNVLSSEALRRWRSGSTRRRARCVLARLDARRGARRAVEPRVVALPARLVALRAAGRSGRCSEPRRCRPRSACVAPKPSASVKRASPLAARSIACGLHQVAVGRPSRSALVSAVARVELGQAVAGLRRRSRW